MKKASQPDLASFLPLIDMPGLARAEDMVTPDTVLRLSSGGFDLWTTPRHLGWIDADGQLSLHESARSISADTLSIGVLDTSELRAVREAATSPTRAFTPEILGLIDPLDPSPLQQPIPKGQPVLLALHGLFSDPSGAFATWHGTREWVRLVQHYQDHVYGYRHPTLTLSPIDNALDLVRRLPEGCELDLICHSRGGHVADILALPSGFRRPREVDAEELQTLLEVIELRDQKQISVRRIVRVGSPMSGTPLATSRRDKTSGISLLLSVGLYTASPSAAIQAAHVLPRLLRLGPGALRLPGIAALAPQSSVIRLLEAAPISPCPTLDVRAETRIQGSFATAIDRWVASLMDGPSDLVVPTASMTGGTRRAASHSFDAPDPRVHHLSYFESGPVRQEIMAFLLQATSRERPASTGPGTPKGRRHAPANPQPPASEAPGRPPQPERVEPTLLIGHGLPDLRSREGLVIGRFEGDSPGPIEHLLDSHLGGVLSDLASRSALPGPARTTYSPPDLPYVLVGLGPSKVDEATVADSLLHALGGLDVGHAPSVLRLLLPGPEASRLDIGRVTSLVLRGLVRLLQLRSTQSRVERVEIWALSLTQAERAHRAARAVQPPHTDLRLNEVIHLGPGRLGLLPRELIEPPRRASLSMTRPSEDGLHIRVSHEASNGHTSTFLGNLPWGRLSDFLSELDDPETDPSSWRTSLSRIALLPALADVILRSTEVLLRLDRECASIPWEALIEPGGGDLALDRPILRQITSTMSGSGPSWRSAEGRGALLLADTDGSLPSAAAEATTVRRHLEDAGYAVRAVIAADAIEALAAFNGAPEVIHIACHGLTSTSGEARIVLGTSPGQPPLTIGVEQLIGGLRDAPKLIVLSCCGPSEDFATPSHREAAARLAQGLLERGVQGLVLTGWRIEDHAARAFADRLYAALLGGSRLAAASLEARRACARWLRELATFSSYDQTWAAFQVYGDPDLSLDPVGLPIRAILPTDQDIASADALVQALSTFQGLAWCTRRDQLDVLIETLTTYHTLVEQRFSGEGELWRRIGVCWRSIGAVDRALSCLERAAFTGGAKDTAALQALDLRAREVLAAHHGGSLSQAKTARALDDLHALAMALTQPLGPAPQQEVLQALRVAQAIALRRAAVDPRPIDTFHKLSPPGAPTEDRTEQLLAWTQSSDRTNDPHGISLGLTALAPFTPLVEDGRGLTQTPTEPAERLADRIDEAHRGAWSSRLGEIHDWVVAASLFARQAGRPSATLDRLVSLLDDPWRTSRSIEAASDAYAASLQRERAEQRAYIELRSVLRELSQRAEQGALPEDPEQAKLTARLSQIAEAHPDLLDQLAETEEARYRRADQPRAVEQTVEDRWDVTRIVQPYAYPSSLDELGEVLKQAKQSSQRIRVVGAARALSEVSNPTGARLVNLSKLQINTDLPAQAGTTSTWARPRLDPSARTWDGVQPLTHAHLIRCPAGLSVRQAIEALRRSGPRPRSMINHGSGDFQGIYSALCTGTHGSGAGLPAIVDNLRALTLLMLDERGEVRVLTVQPHSQGRKIFSHARATSPFGVIDGFAGTVELLSDDKTFDALAMSLGCMGIVISVTLEVQDREMWLEERRYIDEWSRVSHDLESFATSARHVEIQVNPHLSLTQPDPGARLAQVVLRQPTTRRWSNYRPLALSAGRQAWVAPSVVGANVMRALRDPAKLKDNIDTGLRCTAYSSPSHTFVRTMSKALLLNLQYAGTGSEWAVPLSRAKEAAEAILELSHQIDLDLAAAHKKPETYYLTAMHHSAPLTAILTLRFVRSPPSGGRIAMNHRVSKGEQVETWCVFEVGMLGRPSDERFGASPSDLYRAYLAGRQQTFRRIDEVLRPFGARPHWGLHNLLTQGRAEQLWGEDWESWLETRAAFDPFGLFLNAFTDRLGL